MRLELIVYHNVHVTQCIQRALSAAYCGGEGGGGGLSLTYLYISLLLNCALINDHETCLNNNLNVSVVKYPM